MKRATSRLNHAPLRNRGALVLLTITGLLIMNLGCERFVTVDYLADRLLAEQVFESDATANAATIGIYRSMREGLINGITLYNSMVSDDIAPRLTAATNPYVTNLIEPSNTAVAWAPYYSIIYRTNSVIEGLNNSKKISLKAKEHYIAEAKFSRAFCYFNLVNLYGDVPLVLTTDIRINSTMARTPLAEVYDQIIADLIDAKSVLGDDYSYTGGDRSRANKWVAIALLARVYLYLGDWANAESHATEVINAGNYSLLEGPMGVFIRNNPEAIWQWANNTTEANAIAGNFIYTSSPSYICTPHLLNAFEDDDHRKTVWVRTQPFGGQPVSIPFKFTSLATGTNEWYTVMRLAEQYLIRAEAKAMRNDFAGSVSDVNLVREKHGGLTTPLPAPDNQDEALDMILRERQVDLFTEGMHRWFDLKRTGRLNAVMMTEKPSTWNSWAALYPIPFADMQRNPNLVQNPGYEEIN